ncbi:MAG: pyridoxal phosphate-dependent aminotransferase [Candidatus Hatepunaea meridiana]|nr:pyridoxal phosphate-dependent aminotransferase [Candidatus Hatepunaea meridiana]
MLSDRIQRIGFSSTLRINAKATQMKREGVDVIDLSVGEPDFPTPENIKNAAKEALDRNQTKYTANDGIPELRKAIVRKYRDECAADYEMSNVIVSTGAKQSLYNACIALLNKDDECIVPVPYWVSYPPMVSLAKGVPVYVKGREENGFRLTAEDLGRALSARTRAIILNNPSNPTGAAYDPDQLLKIIDVCMDEGLFIIADEIYEKLIYDGFNFKSVAAFGEKVRKNSIIISGFSKSYSMTGWRLGYAVGPRELIEGMSKIQSHATSNATSIAQWAGVEALTGPQHEIVRMRQEFESRRNFMIYKLNGMPHVSCNKPEAAFYAFANFSWYYDKQFEGVPIRNSAGLAYYLLKHAHVALIPGEAFGDDKFIRFSYATSQDNLARALDRVVDALAKLKPTVKAKKRALKIAFTKVMDYSELEASVSIDKRDELVAEAESVLTYDKYSEWCANIGGVVLKFGTNSPHLIDFWMENWYPSPLESDLEPHGLLYSVKDAPGREARAFYNSQTRTGMTFNTAYYPQLRAMTLGMVDDVASRTFDMHLIAGSCFDVNGRGIALITPPGTGGSTHFSSLMRRQEAKFHSYDGFFVRQAGGVPVADSIERKIMMRTDLIRYLPELASLFDRSKLENVVAKKEYCEVEGCHQHDDCPLDRGETHCYEGSRKSIAMLDPYWIGGAAKHVKRTMLNAIILLRKDSMAPKVDKPSAEAALRIIEEGGYSMSHGRWFQIPFYNPYLLVNTGDRIDLLKRQWKRLLKTVPLYVVNVDVMGASEAKESVWELCLKTE